MRGRSSDELRKEVDQGLEWCLTSLESLECITGEELNRHVSGEHWSVGQCIDHLLLSNGPYLIKIRTALASAPPEGENPLFRSTFLGRKMIEAVGPNPKFMVAVPKAFVPRDEALGLECLRELREQLEECRRLVSQSYGLDLEKARVSSPITSLLRFRVGDAFKIIEVHNRRHLLQAHRILQQSA